MPRPKKLQDYGLLMPDKTRYRLSITARCEYEGGPLSIFSIELPWDASVSDTTVKGVIAKANEAAAEQGSLKKEKVLFVNIEGDGHSWDDFDKDHSATLVVNWKVRFRAKRFDGKDVLFKEDGKGIDYGRSDGVEIPWSQQKEDALLAVVKGLHETRTRLRALTNTDEFAKRLASGRLLALPAPKKGSS